MSEPCTKRVNIGCVGIGQCIGMHLNTVQDVGHLCQSCARQARKQHQAGHAVDLRLSAKRDHLLSLLQVSLTVCVCVCACVRACVRACVCMCASCFIIIITHTAPCWPSRRRHYARLGKCKRRPQVGGSSDAGDRACGGPLHLRDIRKRLGACGACVGARYVGGTCAGVGTRHKR